MSKQKFVSPSGKVIELGAKAANATSLRQMGFRPYDEVYAPVPDVVPKDEAPLPEWDATEEKPKRGRPRKNTTSDADQA
jgi:hypothetical protein